LGIAAATLGHEAHPFWPDTGDSRRPRNKPRYTPMSDTFSKVEVITGVARRRRFSTELELAVVAETMQLRVTISHVARCHRLSPSLAFR
jgi:transposase-like protein